MAFCVFMHRSDSIYDDSPAERYQFPKQYLSRAEPSIGDWILYLEPTKVPNSRGYFAVAKLQTIIPDPSADGMFLALIEANSYLDFPNPVAFNQGSGPIEKGLLNEAGKLSGRAQAAVRPISSSDFNRILEIGLNDPEPLLPREDLPMQPSGFEEEQAQYLVETPRSRVEMLTNRVIRDRAFRRVILRAYGERCAVTGLKLINGGGRAEVNAAHIKPVEANGPDIVNNGLALSGTAHWMFDRGLISLGDDLEILVSRHVNNPDDIQGFINRSGFASPPIREKDRPHPGFLEWHRGHCFKH